jgi:hypothetical protein
MRSKFLVLSQKSASRKAAVKSLALLVMTAALFGCSSLTPSQNRSASQWASYYARVDEPPTDN